MAKTLFKVIAEGATESSWGIVDNSGAIQVIIDGSQLASVADATGTADASAAVNNVLARMRSAGLIAPST